MDIKCMGATTFKTETTALPQFDVSVEQVVAAAKAQAEAAAAQAAAAQAAAQAAVEAIPVQNDYGTGPVIIPITPVIINKKVVDPVNGDIIETSFDPVTNTTTVNVICDRKDSPDTLTVTSPTGTDTSITGDGDTFTCNVGYFGSTIASVALPAEYKSSVKIQLKDASDMAGAINTNNKVQYVSLILDKTSKWIVEGTSYLTVLVDEDTTLSNIIDNGNIIYYNPLDQANTWLGGKTYSLTGGGKLMPIE